MVFRSISSPGDSAVLFLDGEALVVDKPAGLPVDPPRRGGPSVTAMARHLRFGFVRAPTPVHRLDQDTSGCLLLARNPSAHRRLSAAFADGRVDKLYLAITDGVPTGDQGLIDLPLAKVSSAEQGWRIVSDAAGKSARTRWRRVMVRENRALIALWPETGRTHQLRVHLASGLKCPIHGDCVYGVPAPAGLMLHAAAVRLDRAGKPPVEARAPWPVRFAGLGFPEIADPAALRVGDPGPGADLDAR